MKNTILSNWSFLRIIRLILGIGIVVQAIYSRDVLIGAMGLLFTSMAVFNFGCCASGGCAVPIKKNSVKQEEVSFEELK